jgi:YggT family protein
VALIVALIVLLARLYQVVLLARVMIGWIQVDPYHPAVQLLLRVTEPVLRPIRELIPSGGGLDFSPLIAILLVQLVASVVQSTFAV